MDKAALYLIPVLLGDTSVERVIPEFNKRIVSELKFFIVENIRSARRFMKKCDPGIDIDSLTFYELNKHTNKKDIEGYLAPMKSGNSMGVISEAGCPAIADPGAEVVAIAQKKGYKVVPLVGPSSLLMAVMASGFNGQSFAFHGYLPIDSSKRVSKIKYLEMQSYKDDQTQLFIETPYRNQKLAEDIIENCKPHTQLCIAMNISCDDEWIVTKSVKSWKGNLPDMQKTPTVFLIYRGK
ncbi:MAG: SAM-dependent methyltransferase [Lascolabacillus sp.]|uniref:SAM-dependent methyltransferase n=2 Tax=Lascolabacillus sp. TaxID=1924068 RepID=UPI000A419051|nr:SAM-dependent methyltransferase [Lascolabacillus sp.]MDD3658781.1 SAM-dependent methyltransferase [Lascolabacillus sp.]MDD4757532.1 SAM-dependent methyltransferase [Lascolabacillus sp.]